MRCLPYAADFRRNRLLQPSFPVDIEPEANPSPATILFRHSSIDVWQRDVPLPLSTISSRP